MKRKRGRPKGSKNKPKAVLLPGQIDQVGCPIQDGPNWDQVSGERTGKQIDRTNTPGSRRGRRNRQAGRQAGRQAETDVTETKQREPERASQPDSQTARQPETCT